MNFLKIAFPALMVIGAFGSLVINLISKGPTSMDIQWLGATLLYIGLTLRNM